MSVFCAGNISHFHLIYLCKNFFLKNKNIQITEDFTKIKTQKNI